jgi:protein farnesyltransferase subunit beta
MATSRSVAERAIDQTLVANSERISGAPADEDPTDVTIMIPPVPSIFTNLPLIEDELVTDSSRMQDQTVQECLPFMTLQNTEDPDDLNMFGVPKLQKMKHLKFLKNIEKDYPAGYVAADGTRPWMVYWALAGMAMLGVDVRDYKGR